MAFVAASGPSRQAARGLATAASTSTPLTASLLLSRTPLLTATLHPLAKAYYERSFKIRHALSNPPSTEFYFKPGSLPLRRFQEAEHKRDVAFYGKAIAGAAPDIGEVQPELEFVETARNHWELQDAARGEKSLERLPEDELFCLVKSKEGRWAFPSTEVKGGEGLDQAVSSRLTGVMGDLGGNNMDTWLVTRKPIGVIREGEKRNFFLRSHILAGEPTLSKDAAWGEHAWLTAAEVETRLKTQGDEKLWESVKGMFGVAEEEL